MLTYCCAAPTEHGQELHAHCYQLPTCCDTYDDVASKERAEVRPAHTFANGSTYTGEWLGLGRHTSSCTALIAWDAAWLWPAGVA
eukprot:symbB.v1.2.006388.t1/scaffold358.1/size381540/11